MADNQIAVAPDLIRWARIRSGRPHSYLQKHFPSLDEWEAEGARLSFEALSDYAKKTHTPIGNFFLENPPIIEVGIPDFRTIRDEQLAEPSTELLETLAICQERQDWYRAYAIANDIEPSVVVGQLKNKKGIEEAAGLLRELLEFEVEDRAVYPNLEAVYRALSLKIESLSVLVMKNGVVGNNTHRPLDLEEFRGFALVDEYAPLIFVNGRDTMAASIFTLLHELVHVSRGESALTNIATPETPIPQEETSEVERWCNRVAAEILVPARDLKERFQDGPDLGSEIHSLSRVYKASRFVVLQSAWDVGLIDWESFHEQRQLLQDAWAHSSRESASGGGQFYPTETTRVGRRFGRALISDTLAGNTLFRDAYRLLATPKHETFTRLAEYLGVQ